jgi:hypothetical protein
MAGLELHEAFGIFEHGSMEPEESYEISKLHNAVRCSITERPGLTLKESPKLNMNRVQL